MSNIESVLDLLKFAPRQKYAFYEFFQLAATFFKDFSFKKAAASVMLMCELLGSMIFDTPVTPHGPELDLTGYELVFCDEFEGDTLNTDVWKHRGEGARRGGFNASTQAKVSNGELNLVAEYLENGKYGEGWYSGMISLKEHYKQGYYEIRCKCSPGEGFWSAFWIQADSPYDHYISQGGVGGAELDIFEAMSYSAKLKDNRFAITSTVHCNGGDDDIENIDSCCVGEFKVGNDIYNEYNTYGLEWTEDEYIFYINGIESRRTSFENGVSQVPEEVIVSLEIPDNINNPKDFTTCMTVDYVKIYQKPAQQ